MNMHTNKVVLVQPPIEDFYLTKKRTLPYGLACIAAAVRNKGFDVELLDALSTDRSRVMDYPEDFAHLKPFYGQKDISQFCLFHEFRHYGYSYEHIGATIRKIKPFIVGISSLFTAYCHESLKTARAIKKFYPDSIIVMGGHHPSFFPEKVLESPDVDFVLRGEGETSMALLCSALKTGLDLTKIPGIAFKTDHGPYISEPSFMDRPGPLPAMDLVNHEFYKRKKRYATVVVSSRGCPMRCAYCSVSAASSHGPFRQRPVKDVLDEIKIQIIDRDLGFIDFEDETLCFNKSWFVELFSGLQELLRGRNIECRAMNGLYPPSIDRDIVVLMKAAGFKTLNLSLGTTSRKQLKRFNRPDVRTAFEHALDLARENGLDCVSYIIAAAPGQTAKSSLDDLLYLAGKRTLAGLSVYYPAPGSLDYTIYKDKKILPENFCLMRSSALPISDTTSRQEALTLLRLSRIINFMKHLKDISGRIPGPEIFPGNPVLPVFDRRAASVKLLQWFLSDGQIRGITPEGEIFTHVSDPDLADQFRKGLATIDIRGTRSDPS